MYHITQYKSSPYHPESQGVLERFLQTLKNMINHTALTLKKIGMKASICCCSLLENLFRNLLIFTHLSWYLATVRRLLKEKLLSNGDSSLNLLQYVSHFKDQLSKACESARTNLKSAKKEMKCWYDENAKERKFMPGDRVLALLHIPGKQLLARYYGPYTVDKKVSDVNYIVKTPGRRKQKQLCHVNMLKQYINRDSSSVTPTSVVSSVLQEQSEMNTEDMNLIESDPASSKLQNSDILKDLDQKFHT